MKKTVTSIFMVPTLKIPKEPLLNNGFINAFIADGRKEVQYEGCIYLLFHPTNLDRFREFLNSEYARTSNVIDDYDYEEGFVMVVYQLDDRFKEDFELIKNGKYSKTSEEFQNLFPKTVVIRKDQWKREEVSLQVRVFEKAPDLVEYWEDKLDIHFTEDMEVWQGFDKENETCHIDFIREAYKENQLI